MLSNTVLHAKSDRPIPYKYTLCVSFEEGDSIVKYSLSNPTSSD